MGEKVLFSLHANIDESPRCSSALKKVHFCQMILTITDELCYKYEPWLQWQNQTKIRSSVKIDDVTF